MNKWLLLFAVPVLLGAALFGGGSGSGAGGGSDHSHFDTQCLDANVVDCWDLRTQAGIDDVLGGSEEGLWTYDAGIDAAKVTFENGSNFNLGSVNKATLSFGETIDPTNSNILSIQFEMRHSDDWAEENCSPDTFSQHKVLRIDNASAVDDERVLEFRLDYSITDRTSGTSAIGVPTLRSYDVTVTSEDAPDPQWTTNTAPITITDGTDNDRQPGGDTGAWSDDDPYPDTDHLAGTLHDSHLGPFIQLSNKWTRHTWIWDYTNGTDNVEFSWLASDEDNGEKTIFESVDSPGSGMGVERTTFNDTGGTKITVGINTSDDQCLADRDHFIWLRNFIVFKDKAIPHGGSPS